MAGGTDSHEEEQQQQLKQQATQGKTKHPSQPTKETQPINLGPTYP
jgi:hypothetical protein